MVLFSSCKFNLILWDRCRYLSKSSCTFIAKLCFSKTCVSFGRCYANQGWAEAVERKNIGLKTILFKFSESLKSVAQGVLEIFEEVYLGWGTMCPPPSLPGWCWVKRRYFSHKSACQQMQHVPVRITVAQDFDNCLLFTSYQFFFSKWPWHSFSN